eukprot:COSAG01_NODE_11247_length_1973_cov_1.139808_1_plen_205_part_10
MLALSAKVLSRKRIVLDVEDPRGPDGRLSEPDPESRKSRRTRLRKVAKLLFVAMWFVFRALLMAGGIFSLQTDKDFDTKCDSGATDAILCEFQDEGKRKTWTGLLRWLVPERAAVGPKSYLGLDQPRKDLTPDQRHHNQALGMFLVAFGALSALYMLLAIVERIGQHYARKRKENAELEGGAQDEPGDRKFRPGLYLPKIVWLLL